MSKICLIATDSNCRRVTASNSIFTSVSILNHFSVTKLEKKFFSAKGRKSLGLWTSRRGNNKDQVEENEREK